MAETESFQIQDLICVAPALFLFIASLLPLTIKVLRKNIEPHSSVPLAMAMTGILASIFSAGLLFAQQSSPYFAFSNALVFDGVSVLTTVVVALITGATAVMARENRATNGEHFSEFLFLLLNSAMGMLILSWANDLIVMFIGIEIMSLCLYLAIAMSREVQVSKEAAFKYFVLGSFASAVFLYGIAFIYGVSGTTYLHTLIQDAPALIAQNNLFVFGVLMAVLGFCFKVAIVPFHAWAPDVYEGAPTPVTAFMATGVKLVTFVAFLRFVRGDMFAHDGGEVFVTIMQWLAAFTMVAGNIAAIMQDNLKRMLAYSSIAHSGYTMIGLIAAALGGESWRGDLGVIYYTLSYAVMTMGAFAIICSLEKKEDDIIVIDDLKGLSSRHPWAAGLFSIFLFSLAGIPPLVGFFGKFFIFAAAIKQGLFWLAVWGAISSVIGVYYYLRPIVYMYMKEGEGALVAGQYKLTRALIVVMAVLVVVFGLATESLYEQVRQAINSLI